MNAGKSKLPPSTSWFTEIRRDSIALVAVSLIFAVVLISQVFGPLKSLTGDEPHYLVVAHSIITDGDVELWDDYNGDKAWKEFYTGELLPHYSPGLKGSYSSRIIGLGVYQAPFYFLGKVFGNVIFWSRLGMALLFSALISMLYLLCRDLGIERKASLYASLTALA